MWKLLIIIEQHPTNVGRRKSVWVSIRHHSPSHPNSGSSCWSCVPYYSPLNCGRALGAPDGLHAAVPRALLMARRCSLGCRARLGGGPERACLVLFWGVCEEGGSSKCGPSSLFVFGLSLLSPEQIDGSLESSWGTLVGPDGGLSITRIRDKQRPNLYFRRCNYNVVTLLDQKM